MARRDEAKPMLPMIQDRPEGHVQCADDPSCRKPGRLWFEGMARNARACIFHSYRRYDRGERDADLS